MKNLQLLKFVIAVAALALCAAGMGHARVDDYSWMRGANYVPSYARNDVQIWMDYNSTTIDKELGYAKALNLNTVRVFLNYSVYEHNREQFLQRFDNFLSLCQKHNIKAMVVLFDSCFGAFPDIQNYAGQDWVANPGQNRIGPEWWPKLEAYVRAILAKHKTDRRIVMWDVMNEPFITSFSSASDREKIWAFLYHFLDYVNKFDTFHPTTVGAESTGYFARIVDKVDVLAFHNYSGDSTAFGSNITWAQDYAKQHNKPVIINECVMRPQAPFSMVMPILKQKKIGWVFWELMLGNTQFSRGSNPIQGLVYPDGTYRDPSEAQYVLAP